MTDVSHDSPDDVRGASAAEPHARWGENAPRGGRTVMNRILETGAKVPMFLGQTLVNSLRDLGYDSTTSAVCEHVDNSIQWGASEVRVYFRQTGKRGAYRIDAAVWDDGEGMPPHVLKVAMAFGGSMVYDRREDIGRYGMGMKAAALSMGPVLDVYSWQEPGAVYNMTLDVEDVGRSRANLIELPDPDLVGELPPEVAGVFTEVMEPKKTADRQDLLAEDEEELRDCLGESGTVIYVPDCDRLSHAKAQTLADHAVKEMGRVYRRHIAAGLRLYVNNRRVEAFDPTYSMAGGRHEAIAREEELENTAARLFAEPRKVPVRPAADAPSFGDVKVSLFRLPVEEWSRLPQKVKKNRLRLSDGHLVSFLRNGREVACRVDRKLGLPGHHRNTWLRVQVEFSGELDEAFGIAANKQGVRPKEFVYDSINGAIGDDVKRLKSEIDRTLRDLAAPRDHAGIGDAESRAHSAEAGQGKPLPALTEE